MITIEQIHAKLADAIRMSGLSQTDIARRIGVKQPTISHYIKGDKMPALDTLANLCKAIDVAPNDILCFND